MKDLFPLKFRVTQQIIDEESKNIYLPNCCIGALSLKEALKYNKEFYHISWGVENGDILTDRVHFRITTKENINFMQLGIPQEVTFIIKYETWIQN